MSRGSSELPQCVCANLRCVCARALWEGCVNVCVVWELEGTATTGWQQVGAHTCRRVREVLESAVV